jgi:hypothetical protein
VCIEVDGALQVAHFKVCVSDFGFVINSHSVIHQCFNEKGQIPCRHYIILRRQTH